MAEASERAGCPGGNPHSRKRIGWPAGESGSGKTTFGRAILRLLHPTEGTIPPGDSTSLAWSPHLMYRKAVQVVFQDPVGSLNPAMTVRDIVAEPFD